MNRKKQKPPLLGFCAWSGTGKTTLLKILIPALSEKGLRIGVIKHAHHHFDIDHPGKDSYVLREAGAKQIVIASRHRMAWIREIDENQIEPSLSDALLALDIDNLDLVLVEGFKHEHFAKIELYRPSLGKTLLYPEDSDIIAIASDVPQETLADTPEKLRVLDINKPEEIVHYIIRFMEESFS